MKLTDAKVSVIVPVYNAEKYLQRCLNSILWQTYKSLEIILVDDGSSDASGVICDAYAARDDRVKVVHKANGGQASARAAGLNKVSGTFLSFVDSDDFIQEDCFAVLLALAAKYDADIVQCSFESGCAEDFTRMAESNQTPAVLSAVDAINSFHYKVSFCGKLYKSDLFRGFSMPAYLRYEDDAAYYRIAYCAKAVCLTEQKLYYYFQSENSVMRRDRPYDYDLMFRIYQERAEFFQKENEKRLVFGTYERLCLITMISFMTDMTQGSRPDEVKRLLGVFRENYKKIKPKRLMPLKNRVMFAVFNAFPRCSSRAVRMLGLR